MSSMDDIIRKLAKLRAKAEGPGTTAEEAATFAAKFQELLVKHELTMSDVDMAKALDADPMGRTFVTGDGVNQRRLWQERLAGTIARAFLCRILVYQGQDAVSFVGRKTHREMAEYVYSRLRDELEDLSNREYKRLRSRLRRAGEPLEKSHDFKPAFRKAYILEIDRRLKAQRAAEEAKLKSAGSGVAIVRLSNALARADEFIENEIKTVKLKAPKSKVSYNELGQARGRHHGSRANLRPDGLKKGGDTIYIGGEDS